LHVNPHEPLLHVGVPPLGAAHPLPHEPQLFTSFDVLVQAPPPPQLA
jgi:hypothetical protein